MGLDRATKEGIVAEFHGKLEGAQLVVRLGFTGLTVGQINTIRREIEKVDGTYLVVVKNTLAKIAAAETSSAPLFQKLSGPNAFLVCDEELVGPAKVLAKFAKDFEKFQILGGVLSGKVISADQVKALATMPTKNELRAQLLAVFKAPHSKFVQVLAAVPRSFLNVLNARRDKVAEAA
ncbi:MAG: 50S ribosomal protein L10 [Deltaproteobacteria bacterium]|nr:50S ribosomal protein L10 [Deltaproteobacteria bacterium]